MKLKVMKTNSAAILPTKAYGKPAGLDLYSIEDKIINRGETKRISTGLAMQIPPGHVGIFFDKSGLALKDLKVLGGVIDEDFSGTAEVILHYLQSSSDVSAFYEVKWGQKIAQMVILPIPEIEIEETDELDETERGAKGFGSSGLT